MRFVCPDMIRMVKKGGTRGAFQYAAEFTVKSQIKFPDFMAGELCLDDMSPYFPSPQKIP